MGVFALVNISVAVSCTALALVASHFGRSRLHAALFAFNASVAVWGFGLFLVGIAENEHAALNSWRIAHLGGFFVGPSYFFLASTFCRLRHRKLLVFAFAQALLFTYLNIGTGLLYEGVRLFHGTYYIQPKGMYLWGLTLYFSFVVGAFILLFRSRRRTSGTRRRQLSYIVWGYMIGFLGATAAMMPLVHLDVFIPYGNLGITIYCLVITYAILKHRLMDIRVALRKSLVYSLSVSILVGLFLVVVLLLTGILSDLTGSGSLKVSIFAALLIAFLFNPLRDRVQALVDLAFRDMEEDPFSTIEKAGKQLLTSMDVDSMCNLIVDSIFEGLKVESVHLYTLGRGDYSTFLHRSHAAAPTAGSDPAQNLSAKTAAVETAIEDGIFIAGESTEDPVEGSAAGSVESAAILPIFVENRARFLLVLGEKISGNPYTEKDVRLLKSLAAQAGIALKNALLYREILDMNRKLQEEITVRRQVEERLGAASREWLATFDSKRDIVILTDSEGRVVRLNEQGRRFFGKSFVEIMGRPLVSLFREAGIPPLDRTPAPGRPAEDARIREFHLPGKSAWLQLTVDPIREQSGDFMLGAVHTLHDITRLKELEETISRAKLDWEESFDVISDAITIHDREFNILRANRAAREMLALPYATILGQKCFQSYHGTDAPPEACPSCRTLETGEPVSVEVREEHLGRHLEIKALPRLGEGGEVIGLVHVVRDISERISAEQERARLHTQLLQAQKMESIGRLAGGVAHDFNNLLTTIIGYSEVCMLRLPSDSPLMAHLRIIMEAGEKAGSLTRQLLAFSRKQVLEMKTVDVNSVITGLAGMLRRLISEDVALEIVQHSSRMIEADTNQLEQIIMNLAVNARDAMPLGGKLVIETRDVEIAAGDVDESSGLKPGDCLQLTVSDSGEGISPEDQEKIFEPFFTTKALGKGTGLGLATVYGIVRQHRGTITVRSAPGEGTTFTLLFPAAESEPEAEKVEDSTPRRGSETIMIVDDEPMIREMVATALEPLGYRVLVAGSGEEALQTAEESGGEIDLFITDVVMPHMSGRDFAAEVDSRWPGAKVVYISGYTDDIIAPHGILESEVRLIHKPLRPLVLADIIREELDGRE